MENQTERETESLIKTSLNRTVCVTLGKEKESVEVVFDLEKELEEIEEHENIFKVKLSRIWCILYHLSYKYHTSPTLLSRAGANSTSGFWWSYHLVQVHSMILGF